MEEHDPYGKPAHVPSEEGGRAGGTEIDSDGWEFAGLAQFAQALGDDDSRSRACLETVCRLEHDVPVGRGQTIRVSELFTMSSWLRQPRRAVLLLCGSAWNRLGWNIPVPGYDGADMLARRGFFTYVIDPMGVGASSTPANGLDATFESNEEGLRQVLRHARVLRGVPRVDVLGEGWGATMASRLAADAVQVRSAILSAMVYKDLVAGPVRDPAFAEAIRNAPGGYLPVPPESYEGFLQGAPEAVKDFIRQTQPGAYPTPMFLIVLEEPPFFDPSVANVPGLVLFGKQDVLVGPEDPYHLARDYGSGGAKLIVSEEAGHAPRVESPEAAEWFWAEVFRFLEE